MYISITSFLYSRFSKILLKCTHSSALYTPEKGKEENRIFIFQWNKLYEKYLPISCKGSSCWHTFYYHQLECSLLINTLSQRVVFHRGTWTLISPCAYLFIVHCFPPCTLKVCWKLPEPLGLDQALCRKKPFLCLSPHFPLNFIYCKKGN